MLRIASFIAALTIVSKILGLIRDLMIAYFFGTSMQADAFNMAYLLTGNFFVIFGGIGGPYYNAMVAVLPKIKDDLSQSKKFIYDSLVNTTGALIVFTLVFYLFEKPILSFFINATTHKEYFDLTIINLNLLLPLIIISAPIGIVFAVLNCFQKYASPSLSPGVLNIVLIICLLIMGDGFNGLALAIGTSLGSIVSLVFQLPEFSQVTKAKPAKEPQKLTNKEFQNLLYPALLSTAATQIMVFIDSYFCKDLAQGSWSALVLGNRLIQMPLGVLLTALLIPVFPRISELVSVNKLEEVRRLLFKSTGILIGICLPGVIIGMIFCTPLIKLIFEHGAFDASSTQLVSIVVFYLLLSVFPYILRDSLTRTLYSFGDSQTPLFVMLIAILLKIPLNYFLVKHFAIGGIAIATSISSFFNALVLGYFVFKRLGRE